VSFFETHALAFSIVTTAGTVVEIQWHGTDRRQDRNITSCPPIGLYNWRGHNNTRARNKNILNSTAVWILEELLNITLHFLIIILSELRLTTFVKRIHMTITRDLVLLLSSVFIMVLLWL